MGRPERFGREAILEFAKELSAEVGPQRLTIAAVSDRSGAPVGSIYHRYESRDEILAEIWLGLVEGFQARFLTQLEGKDAIRAGLAAVRFTCAWIRGHATESRLMLLHRREDFAADRWSPDAKRRARLLTERADQTMGEYAFRLTGRRNAAALRQARFAVLDLPTAALRRDVEAGTAPAKYVERMLLDACAYSLRRSAGREGRKRD